jgi:LPXTG-motif cell wall-anchored protein
VTIALAAAPAAAVAQNGAGDDQYQDPFSGGSQQPASKPKPKPAPSQQQTAPSTQQSAPSTQQAAPQAAPSAQQATATAQQPAAATQQLPRTGFDVLPLVIGGIALVAAGLALRRRAAHDR